MLTLYIFIMYAAAGGAAAIAKKTDDAKWIFVAVWAFGLALDMSIRAPR